MNDFLVFQGSNRHEKAGSAEHWCSREPGFSRIWIRRAFESMKRRLNFHQNYAVNKNRFFQKEVGQVRAH